MLNVGLKGEVVVVEYERGWYIRDAEFQLSAHHTEAGFGEKSMVRSLVAPELLDRFWSNMKSENNLW